jgi:hypothetical protein
MGALLVGLLSIPCAASPPGVWVRCPEGLRPRQEWSGFGWEAWCEAAGGGRQGPAVVVSVDGHRREGAYLDGRRHGVWREMDAAGRIVRTVSYWHAIAGREVADPEGLCPAGSTRVRVGILDARNEDLVGGRVQDQCLALDPAGNPIQEGPTVIFSRQVADAGDGTSCPLQGWVRGITAPFSPPVPEDLGPVWDLAWYHRGVMHGVHRRWNPAGRLVLEETLKDGEVEGASPSPHAAELPVPVPVPDTAGRRVGGGRLLFDGRPYRGPMTGPAAPVFWFRDEGTGAEAHADVLLDEGSFAVHDLPDGDYFVDVSAETEPANGRGLPGDMEGFQRFRVVDGMAGPIDIHLHRILHLTAPVDNGAKVPGSLAFCGKEKAWPQRPLRFAWEGMGEGVEYRYRVIRAACTPWRALEDLVSSRTDRTEVHLHLPPTAAGEGYLFEVAAFRHGRRIGGLALQDDGANGWRYAFRIR